jgi:hypothetical protein
MMPKRRNNPLELMIVNPGEIKRKGIWPKTLVGMGTCPDVAIVPEGKKNKKTITFAKKKEPIIATDARGRSIYIIAVPQKKTNASRMRAGETAVKKFEQFHLGDGPDEIVEVKFEWPETIKKIGKCKWVSYRSYDHTQKKGTPYRHIFEKHPDIYIDPDQQLMYIVGANITVTDWIRG